MVYQMLRRGTGSGLAGAAQDVDQLMSDQILDVGAGGLQVLGCLVR